MQNLNPFVCLFFRLGEKLSCWIFSPPPTSFSPISSPYFFLHPAANSGDAYVVSKKKNHQKSIGRGNCWLWRLPLFFFLPLSPRHISLLPLTPSLLPLFLLSSFVYWHRKNIDTAQGFVTQVKQFLRLVHSKEYFCPNHSKCLNYISSYLSRKSNVLCLLLSLLSSPKSLPLNSQEVGR